MSKKVCSTMKSCISELPDDLLLKILSFLSTKQAVVTSLLSKQWKSLWTKVSRLEYNDEDHKNRTSFKQFIDKSLFLHKSHVLESLCIKISSRVKIEPWIRTVFRHHHCHLRELEIDASNKYTPLPHELFTCKTLVVLKLKGEFIDVEALTTVCLPSLKVLHVDHSSLFVCGGSLQMLLSNCNFLTDVMVIIRGLSLPDLVDFDVSWCKTLVSLKLEGFKDINISSSSSTVCLPFLNTLYVERIVNLDNDSFCRLLSNCPLLSDLTLEEKTSDVMLDLDIVMPCLQRLSIIAKVNLSKHLCSLLEKYIRKLAIVAPYFKYLSIIKDSIWYPFTLFYVKVGLGDTSKLEYKSIFHQIVHLELSLCSGRSGEMLVDLLICFTKLVVLKLKNIDKLYSSDHWEMPSFVPECLLSSLEALEWRGYTGRTRDKDMLSYLLNHSLCLKTAKIFSDLDEKQQGMEDLASMPRGSQSCQVLVLK